FWWTGRATSPEPTAYRMQKSPRPSSTQKDELAALSPGQSRRRHWIKYASYSCACARPAPAHDVDIHHASQWWAHKSARRAERKRPFAVRVSDISGLKSRRSGIEVLSCRPAAGVLIARRNASAVV